MIGIVVVQNSNASSKVRQQFSRLFEISKIIEVLHNFSLFHECYPMCNAVFGLRQIDNDRFWMVCRVRAFRIRTSLKRSLLGRFSGSFLLLYLIPTLNSKAANIVGIRGRIPSLFENEMIRGIRISLRAPVSLITNSFPFFLAFISPIKASFAFTLSLYYWILGAGVSVVFEIQHNTY